MQLAAAPARQRLDAVDDVGAIQLEKILVEFALGRHLLHRHHGARAVEVDMGQTQLTCLNSSEHSFSENGYRLGG